MPQTSFFAFVLLLSAQNPSLAFISGFLKRNVGSNKARPHYASTSSSNNAVPILTPETDPQGILTQVAKPVIFDSNDNPHFYKDMKDTIDSLHATLFHTQQTLGFGRAMAAPQAGVSLRIVVLNMMGNIGMSSPITLINPNITWRSVEMQTVWDDCLSIPDKLVQIERHQSISLEFQDLQGIQHEWHRLPLDLSELLQHELEHLDGILMTHHAATDNVKPNDLSHLQSRSCSSQNSPQRRIQLENIYSAYNTIDPAFTNSPFYPNKGLSDLFQTNLFLKDETQNPIRCFKGRGADYYLSCCSLPKNAEFVCASAGNWGLAVASACQTRKLPCTVFVAETAKPSKVAKIIERGARVIARGHDFDAAKQAAKQYYQEQKESSPERNVHFVDDGKDQAVTEGAGSIGVELTRQNNRLLDAVLVPVGNGSLINGIARWIQVASPMTRVIGIVPANADSMYLSWQQRKVVNRESAHTSADGLAVREPVLEAIQDMEGLVDDMVLVEERHLEEAVAMAEQHANLVLEPSGAATIAGLLAMQEQQLPSWDRLKHKNVVCIVTGANR